MRSDGSVRWHGGLEALRQWQQAVDEACLDADPFRAWQLDDTVACLRGLVDCRERPARQSAALPNPARRAVRRAGRGDARRDVEAALAAGQLDSWLAAPVGRLQRVSRYLYELWLGRPDLHGLFPRVGDNDASTSAYLAWVRASGSRELAIPDLFMPSTGLVRARLASGLPTTRGVRVTGHVDETIGIGEAARRVEQALAREGIPHARLLDPASGEFDVDVLCINASEVGLFVSDVGAEHLARRYTIGVWFWESTSPPPNVDSALEVVDEVWVASDYVRQALAPYVGDTPIHVMPLAVREPAPVAHPRSHFALPEDAYLYGFMFDFNSTLERKNAIGLVEAYMRAYPEVRADTALVIKTIHAELNVADHERLLLATSDRDDIIVIDAHLSIEERDSMLGLLDCYVSLHRSEGFGLTIAEALLAGVPTIATGYSANVEFAPADVCYLVDHEMKTVPDGLGPYPAGGEWAAPDLDHAARLMLHVREHPAEAREKARLGGERIRRECSLDAAGAFMRTRLEQIWKEHPLPDPDEIARAERAADPITAVERYVNDGPTGGWHAGQSGLRRRLRSVLLRFTRPYADRQKEFEVDVARSLRTLQQQVDELRER